MHYQNNVIINLNIKLINKKGPRNTVGTDEPWYLKDVFITKYINNVNLLKIFLYK